MTAGSSRISAGVPSAILRPKSRTSTRSQMRSTSSTSCSISSTARPRSSARRRTWCPSSSVSLSSSPAAGSSRSNTDGAEASARAMPTRRRRPYGSSLGRRSRSSCNWNSRTLLVTAGGRGRRAGQNRSRSAEKRVCSAAPACRFSPTEMSSKSSSDWNVRRSPARARRAGPQARPPIGTPARLISPRFDRTKPVTASTMVVLPGTVRAR